MLFGLLRKSNWKFVSSSGGEVSVSTPVVRLGIGATKGKLFIKQKTAKKPITLNYSGNGASVGLSLVPTPVKLSFSMREMPSSGVIYKTPNAGKKLTIDEFKGGFVMMNIGADIGAGYSQTLIFLGVNKFFMRLIFLNPVFFTATILTAEACIRIGGMSANVVPANASLNFYVGTIS